MIVQLPLDDDQVVVVFCLPASIWADSIHLVGDFNGWSTRSTPMRLGEQYWEARLTLPAGGTYYYAYLIDETDWRSEHCGARGGHGEQQTPINLRPIEILQGRPAALAR